MNSERGEVLGIAAELKYHLPCRSPGLEFAEVFFTVAGQKLSSEVADRLREAYESDEGCSG